MRGLSELEHHQVGNVDDVVDRTNTDALDLRADPLRARADFYVIDLSLPRRPRGIEMGTNQCRSASRSRRQDRGRAFQI